MSDVPIGVVGEIVSLGDRHCWFVKVEEDSQNAGVFK
jgi:hypothetical protein